MMQLTLNLSIEFFPREGDSPSMVAERFAAFHKANPHVYVELRRLALEAKARGLKKLGMRALYEVLRWNDTDTVGGAFKLNNDLCARYARMLEAEPELTGMFELRELRS